MQSQETPTDGAPDSSSGAAEVSATAFTHATLHDGIAQAVGNDDDDDDGPPGLEAIITLNIEAENSISADEQEALSQSWRQIQRLRNANELPNTLAQLQGHLNQIPRYRTNVAEDVNAYNDGDQMIRFIEEGDPADGAR